MKFKIGDSVKFIGVKLASGGFEDGIGEIIGILKIYTLFYKVYFLEIDDYIYYPAHELKLIKRGNTNGI